MNKKNKNKPMQPSSSASDSPANIDLNALDIVLDTFVTAAKDPNTSRGDLYGRFHRRLIAATDAIASAVFSKRPDSQFTMVSHEGWRNLDAKSLAEIKNSIKQQYSSKNPNVRSHAISTFVGKSKAVNGVEFLYVLVRRKDSDPLIHQVFEDLTQEIASQIENFEIRRTVTRKPKAIQDLAHLVQLTQNIGKSRNLTQLAMHLVNDLGKSTGADRVCFFNPNGKLIAVSGVSQVSFKTSLARNLSRIARIAKSSNLPIESSENQVVFGDTRRLKKVRTLVEDLDSEVLYVSPLQTDNRCRGIVSFEYFQQAALDKEWTDQRNLIVESLNFIAPVIGRAVEVHSIPGIRFFDFLFNNLITKPVRLLLWAVALSSLILVGLYFLLLVERPFEIHAEGVLQPAVTRNVFSPQDGEIKSLFVEEGTLVEEGQQLAIIESKELQDQMIVIRGEMAEANQELQNLALADYRLSNSDSPDEEAIDRQTETASEIKRLNARVETLQTRLDLFQQQAEELVVVSPIVGQITTADVDHRLDSRPVNRGDLLMAVSDMKGEWEIELMVPDSRIEFIEDADSPSVRFRIASDSELIYDGEIRNFDFRVEPDPATTETQARAILDFEESELGVNLRAGSRVIAKIDCGKKNNLFLLTYELRNKIREWFFY